MPNTTLKHLANLGNLDHGLLRLEFFLSKYKIKNVYNRKNQTNLLSI